MAKKEKPMTGHLVETEESKPKHDDYEVKQAVETLMKAEEIKDDPELMKLCKAEMAKKGKALKKITSVDQIRNASNGSPDDEDDIEETLLE